MIKKTFNYIDFDGNERTEDAYFNMTKTEIAEMEFSVKGGFTEMVKKLVEEEDTKEIFRLFKEIILAAYGVKSADGRRFIKDKKLAEEFSQTEAFSDLIFQCMSDTDFAAEFINGLAPKMENAAAPVMMGA